MIRASRPQRARQAQDTVAGLWGCDESSQSPLSLHESNGFAVHRSLEIAAGAREHQRLVARQIDGDALAVGDVRDVVEDAAEDVPLPPLQYVPAMGCVRQPFESIFSGVRSPLGAVMITWSPSTSYDP